jgi:hypothetical protein
MKDFFHKYSIGIDIIEGNNTNHFYMNVKALIINEQILLTLSKYDLNSNDKVYYKNRIYSIQKIEKYDIYDIATLKELKNNA